MNDVEPPDSTPASPYKGFSPFTEKDAPFFFGRDKERKIISANLRTRRLTLLYGPSGVGKSSVIHAGVVHHIRQRARHQPPQHLPSEQAAYSLAWSGSPTAPKLLITARKPVLVVVFDTWAGNSLEALRASIRTNLETLPEFVTNALSKHDLTDLPLADLITTIAQAGTGIELLIILDQFEGYFVHHATDEDSRDFDDQFSRAVANPEIRANFLISIREDWIARLDRFRGRIPGLFENAIRIDHLRRDAARDAIAKPIDRYNEIIRNSGKGHPQVRITEDFVDEAVKQLEQLHYPVEPTEERLREGGERERRIHGSGLQIVMQSLWDRIITQPSPQLTPKLLPPGEAERIFQSHLARSLNQLNVFDKYVAEGLFPLLITSSGAKFADTAKGLERRAHRSQRWVERLLRKLIEVKIVSEVAPLPGQETERRYEITSDVLAKPLLDWSDANRDKRMKTITALIVLLGFVLVLVALWVGDQRRLATLKEQQAQIQKEKVQKAIEVEKATFQRALDAVAKQDEHIPYSKAVLRGHGKKVTSAVFTPNGQVLTASADSTAILWDVESKRPIYQPFQKDQKGLVCAAVNPKGDTVVTASTDGAVVLWQLPSGGSRELRQRIGKHVTDISFSPDGNFIAAANTAGDVILWDARDLERVMESTGNGRAIRQIAFSPSGKLLAAASEDRTAHIWQLSQKNDPMILTGHDDRINGLAFSPDELYLATASSDTTVRVWDLSTGNSRVFRGHVGSVNSVDYDTRGERLLSTSDDTTARIWTITTEVSTSLIGHTDKVLSGSFSPDDLQVVTASSDTTARIWSVRTAKPLVELWGNGDEVNYVSYSSDGKYVLTAGDDATARVWYAPESGGFEIIEPSIEAYPNFHPGVCPITVRFTAGITSVKGSGTVIYRFKDSNGRVWPPRELTFEAPGIKYVNWYWRITEPTKGFEAIEILEPKGIKEKRAAFEVKCSAAEVASPSPTPTPSP